MSEFTRTLLGVVALGSFVLGAMAGGGEPVPDVLRAKRLEIVDDAGKVRVVIGKGDTRLPEGAWSIVIHDARGGRGVSLCAFPEGGGAVEVLDRNAPRLECGVSAGTASIGMWDETNAFKRLSAWCEKGGAAGFGLRDAEGRDVRVAAVAK